MVTVSDLKNLADLVGAIVTPVAVVAGGTWAYFKFVKGRTFRPRLEVGLFGQWRLVNGQHLLQARIKVKNIGASKVTLIQKGSGLRVSMLADVQRTPPCVVAWQALRVFETLREHEWIEPGETVSDDLLLDVGVPPAQVVLFEARLGWKWAKRSDAIVVFARQIIAAGATVDGREADASPAAQKERRTDMYDDQLQRQEEQQQQQYQPQQEQRQQKDMQEEQEKWEAEKKMDQEESGADSSEVNRSDGDDTKHV